MTIYNSLFPLVCLQMRWCRQQSKDQLQLTLSQWAPTDSNSSSFLLLYSTFATFKWLVFLSNISHPYYSIKKISTSREHFTTTKCIPSPFRKMCYHATSTKNEKGENREVSNLIFSKCWNTRLISMSSHDRWRNAKFKSTPFSKKCPFNKFEYLCDEVNTYGLSNWRIFIVWELYFFRVLMRGY